MRICSDRLDTLHDLVWFFIELYKKKLSGTVVEQKIVFMGLGSSHTKTRQEIDNAKNQGFDTEIHKRETLSAGICYIELSKIHWSFEGGPKFNLLLKLMTLLTTNEPDSTTNYNSSSW